MREPACECGHGGITQHVENTEGIGYRCTVCPCPLLRGRPGKWVDVPDEDDKEQTDDS
jgi:hypothetical protein